MELTASDQAALDVALRQTKAVRPWRRYRAVQLLATGQSAVDVAQTLGCGRSTVELWRRRWQAEGIDGLHEHVHPGGRRRLDAAAEARLTALLEQPPEEAGYHTSGWTAELLQGALAKEDRPVSLSTLRRTLRRLGWRWKRPKYVLGRPDPDYEAKKGRS